MPTPHEASIKAANRTSRGLATLFGKLGTKEHPRGQVLTAYRVARRALKGNTDNRFVVQDVLTNLRFTIQAIIQDILGDALDLGTAQAEIELAARELAPPGGFTSMDPALQAIMAVLEAQLTGIDVASQMGEGDEVIIGDDERAGLLTPTIIISQATQWLTRLTLESWSEGVESSVGPLEFMKQAVAAIDQRTTDTCLRAHGQIVDFDGLFKLTGTPRYADELPWTPFHDWCRTSVVMVLPEDADDETTQRMRAAAKNELAFRDETQTQIDTVKRDLADLGEAPDIRQRKKDVPHVTTLRLKLRRLKNLMNKPTTGPADAFSGRF